MGFIENNKAECMLSVLINTNLLRACLKNNIKKYFFSSAHVFTMVKNKGNFCTWIKRGRCISSRTRGWLWLGKTFSERMCRHFTEDFGLPTRVLRYHNVYGPLGTFDGGREKAPAALCRKIINAKINNQKEIEVWGDGEQTRSFMFIDDCLIGTQKLFNSETSEVFNLGSDEQVSINQMIGMIEEISDFKVNKKYLLDKPKGVRGRSSDNTNLKNQLNWVPSVSLKDGLEKTYNWIYNQIKSKENSQKFTRSY